MIFFVVAASDYIFTQKTNKQTRSVLNSHQLHPFQVSVMIYFDLSTQFYLLIYILLILLLLLLLFLRLLLFLFTILAAINFIYHKIILYFHIASNKTLMMKMDWMHTHTVSSMRFLFETYGNRVKLTDWKQLWILCREKKK